MWKIIALYTLVIAPLIVPISACEYRARDGTCYGKELRSIYFYQSRNFTNLNHGSFGAVPKPVHEKQMEYFLEQEAYPDTWFRQSMYEKMDASREVIARYIRAHVSDVVLVENASSAVNSILRSMQFQQGDKVLRLDTSYNMVVRTLDYLVETIGIKVIVVEVPMPIATPNQLVSRIEQALQQNPDVKLCIFSHISSFPAIVEPLDDIAKLVHEIAPSSLILVDGAHAPGEILNLDVPSYNVDFYLGNCHKWLYAPKGTAFLWVAPSRHESAIFPEPTVISSKPAKDFVERYSYTGTRDYTAFASLPAAFEFREFLGGEEQIITYCHNLAIRAGTFLAKSWGTQLLVPETMSAFMVNVVLPSQNATAIAEMQATLNSTYNIYMVAAPASPAKYAEFVFTNDDESAKGDCWGNCETYFITRMSAQVYLDFEDFRKLGDLVPKLLERIIKGEKDSVPFDADGRIESSL